MTGQISTSARDRIIEVVEAEQSRLKAREAELVAIAKSTEEELAQVRGDLGLTGRTHEVLAPPKPRKTRAKRRKPVTDPAKAAGPANVAAVREFLEAHGRASQAEVRKGTGKNSGSVSLSLRALEEQGVARATPYKDGRSRVWEVAYDREEVLTAA